MADTTGRPQLAQICSRAVRYRGRPGPGRRKDQGQGWPGTADTVVVRRSREGPAVLLSARPAGPEAAGSPKAPGARPRVRRAAGPGAGAPPKRVHRNVKLLGVNSLLTDISSESVNAVLPLYLMSIGFTPLASASSTGSTRG